MRAACIPLCTGLGGREQGAQTVNKQIALVKAQMEKEFVSREKDWENQALSREKELENQALTLTKQALTLEKEKARKCARRNFKMSAAIRWWPCAGIRRP